MLIQVKPAPGARVRQPNRGFNVMPESGDFVSVDDTYYNRLLRTGDIVLVVEDAEQKKPAKADK